MKRTAKPKREPLSKDQIRGLILRYFYERNENSTSAMGKKGSAVKIRDVKSQLKAQHELTQTEVQSNLTYLISQGWVEEKQVKKEFKPKGGSSIPAITSYYQITAAGIDKIEGPGEFTMPKFHDIHIEATGQNIITVGDGNQIDARFEGIGEALSELRKFITESTEDEAKKLSLVADIETIQSQLAKPTPNKGIVAAAWEAVQFAATIDGAAGLIMKVSGLLSSILS